MIDKRHTARIKTVQELYTALFPNNTSSNKLSQKTEEILQHHDHIDNLIEQAAPKFPVPKIAFVDLSILRLAIFELIFEKKAPPKVIINEAVELAKDLGSEKSPGFINAVLGKIYMHHPEKTL